ncbi:MAG TPA: crosslink repair DNA glycosylase YcaQ family protein [Solirubrobacteraceae bacterium]
MDVEQILAFRLARSGLASRDARTLAEAASCPASDFSRDAALLAVAARAEGVTRESYDAATDSGELVVAHVARAAIHAVAPDDFALYGRALVATDDDELGVQLGRQVQGLAAEHGFAATAALDEVAEATRAAVAGGARPDKNELHAGLRERVSKDLMPWCKGCGSHHVAPMLWRYGVVKAGVRLDSERRYVPGRPGRTPAASGAVERFLHFYGPSTVGEFAAWAGIAKPHAARLWKQVEGELSEVSIGNARGRPGGKANGRAWALTRDAGELESPVDAAGVRLLPPGDPYLQKTNRPLLAPDAELRKRLFRPVASPGAIVEDGRLVGLWRVKAKGRQTAITVEKIGRVAKADLEAEAGRVAELRGAAGLVLEVA